MVVLSEYGITDVNHPVALNRFFREQGWLAIREERGLELLDAGASKVFSVPDHQIAHIYVRDRADLGTVRSMLETVEGVAEVWGEQEKQHRQISHPRSGDLIVLSDPKVGLPTITG